MARWLVANRPDPATLLAGFERWWDRRPPLGSPERDGWQAGLRRWCAENGTTVLELIRMQRLG
jgi:hypothetical protein